MSRLVHPLDSAVLVERDNAIGYAVHHGSNPRFAFALQPQRSPELDRIHFIAGPGSKIAEELVLVRLKLARTLVDNAERAELTAVGAFQEASGIEANVGLAGDERVVGKTGILGRVGNNEDVVP